MGSHSEEFVTGYKQEFMIPFVLPVLQMVIFQLRFGSWGLIVCPFYLYRVLLHPCISMHM